MLITERAEPRKRLEYMNRVRWSRFHCDVLSAQIILVRGWDIIFHHTIPINTMPDLAPGLATSLSSTDPNHADGESSFAFGPFAWAVRRSSVCAED